MLYFTVSYYCVVTIAFHCISSVYRFNVLLNCTISLYHISVSFQYIIKLYNFTVSHQCIVSMYHSSVPFHCTILLYHFIVPFQCISTLVKYALLQSLSMLYVYYSTYRDNKQSLQNVKTFVNFSTYIVLMMRLV